LTNQFKSNLPASVRARLLNQAREKKEDYNLVLIRYALERLMYRLSVSKHSKDFVLKGAMLFDVWGGPPYRATKDMDLFGYGNPSRTKLERIFKGLCKIKVDPDGLEYISDSVRVDEIREDQEYSGVRVRLEANLAGARIRGVQVDIGFGDVVVPRTKNIEFPTILDFPAPKLAAYSPETVVSEKFQAIVFLGMANTRMKDFFDLNHISHIFEFKGVGLSRAIKATFNRRKTEIPRGNPIAFTPDFHNDPEKQAQWNAFVRRNGLPEDYQLPVVIEQLKTFLLPPTHAVSSGEKFIHTWPEGGPWEQAG